MSGLGGLACMLPMRLGSPGISAAGFNRIASTVVGACKVAPFARLTCEDTTISVYFGQNGLGGTAFPSGTAEIPTVSRVDSTTVIVTFPESWLGIDGKQVFVGPLFGFANTIAPIGVSSITVTRNASQPNIVWVEELATSELRDFNLTVYGGDQTSLTINDFDSDIDKRDCRSEVEPYAIQAYRAIQGYRGSLYAQEPTGFIFIENATLARMHAGRMRDIERIKTNANPATSWELAEDWKDLLGSWSSPLVSKYELLRRNASKFVAIGIPSIDKVNAVCSRALGSRFVGITRITGSDLAHPPEATFWPGVNTGPSSWDLGGGTWLSSRSQLYVTIAAAYDQFSPENLEKYGDLMRTLDDFLPSWVKVGWVIQGSVFNLDTDPMDVTQFGV